MSAGGQLAGDAYARPRRALPWAIAACTIALAIGFVATTALSNERRR